MQGFNTEYKKNFKYIHNKKNHCKHIKHATVLLLEMMMMARQNN